MTKVIGIGLPKTATSSLAGALNLNNVPTIHFGSPECEEITQKMYRGVYKFGILDRYTGVTNAFEMLFPQIDKAYPGSKFIYTIRDKDSWLVTAEKHWGRALANPKINLMLIHHHLITFGTYLFNKDRFSFVYDMHSDMVKNYFINRSKDLLVLDITKETDYVYKVCDFLGVSVIDGTPVHFNKG
jgi:hypothetical protein